MAKRSTNRRAQTAKDKVSSRVRRVQDIRRSNAAGPMPSRVRYDRNGYRAMAQSGRYSEDD